MTHGKTEQLLYDIENKLKTLTMKDFCIILIGEEDFKSSNDYFQLIVDIRVTLQRVNHTNIIVCTPTFQFSFYKNMYNSRVETFNNLLYLDILTNKHAYFLDSNKNLASDYTMFNKRTGILNNYGMQTILKYIDEFISGIKKYDLLTNDSLMNYNEQDENQFFL